MNQKQLRDSLGLFATGIIVACARKKNFLSDKDANPTLTQRILNNKVFGKGLKETFTEEFFGMTINSFSSVSMDPPLVSFCVDNRSSNLNLFKKNRYFALNVLSEEQQTLASGFATPKNSEKWQIEPYYLGQNGSPIFENSLGFFECKRHRVIKAGDHHIIIGEVVDFDKIQDKGPLIYNRSQFRFLKD